MQLDEFQDGDVNWAEVDPDTLKNKGERPQSIIYTSRLYLDPDQTGRSHISFYNNAKGKGAERLQAELGVPVPISNKTAWFRQYNNVLFGRLGWYDGRQVVSFWGRGWDYQNPQARGPAQLIQPCVEALMLKGAVDDDTVVVFGDGRYTTVSELRDEQAPKGKQDDPAALEKQRAAAAAHMATGAEKRILMRYSGRVIPPQRKHPIATAMTKAGLLSPGQKWWGMEGFERRLMRVLESTVPAPGRI